MRKLLLRRLIPILAFVLLAWVIHKNGGVDAVINILGQGPRKGLAVLSVAICLAWWSMMPAAI